MSSADERSTAMHQAWLLKQTPLTADQIELRKPVRFANYRGDARGRLGCFVGPNTMGEVLHIVSEDYDPDTDRTRVGFAYGRPKEKT